MWMLERAAGRLTTQLQVEQYSQQLAACPDTHGRGDKWKWAINFVAQDPNSFVPVGAPSDRVNVVIDVDGRESLVVSHDPTLVSTLVELNEQNSNLQIFRQPGTEVIVIPLFGQALISAPNGVWKRLLEPNDIFVIEGEEGEQILLSPSPDLTRVVVIHLESNAAQALRWVP